MATVLLPGCNHLSIPNLPRKSRHTLIRPKKFPSGRYPLNKIWPPFASLAAWQPVGQNYHLVHSFNCIPYTKKPWIVTFEQHLSLYRISNNNLESFFREKLKDRLALDNCQKIIAISDYARMRFLRQLEGWPLLTKVINKLKVIHPNFPIRVEQYKKYTEGEYLKLIFVGNHFARKGGIVALRLAKKAENKGLPIKIHLISEMRYGSGVPTDFPDKTRYEKDLNLLKLPNVVAHQRIHNSEVIKLLMQSHFQIMATLHDTYGYSIIEGFSVATPAITTNVCALPEFVHHGENGYVIPLEINDSRHWNNWLDASLRNSDEYWDILDSTYEALADQALQLLVEFFDRPDRREHYERLSAGAIAQAKNVHDSQKINDLLDNLYSKAAGEVIY